MSFIFRGLLILFLFALIVYVMKAIARLRFNLSGTMRDVRNLRDRIEDPRRTSRDAVRCTSCGTFLDRREALVLRTAGAERTFCSKQCINSNL